MPDNMREKLIEILKDDDCPLLWMQGDVGNLADYLIANGVTVLSQDEQRNVYTVQEIENIQNEAYDLGADSVLHHKFGFSWNDAAELRKEIKRLRDATKWIPVTERLPDIEGEYITYTDRGQIHFDCFCIYPNHGTKFWVGGNGKVTHWMEKPKPPKGE